MSNITFIFFAYNEEKRIEYIVRNCVRYGRVLILDGGSSDNTETLAQKNGADWIRRPETKNVITENQEMYDFIKKNVTTDWIFWGFCDNLMPNSLLEKLVELSKQNSIKYVNIPMYTYLWGQTDHPAEKSRSPRFFMKNQIDFTDNHIHGMGKFLGKKEEILVLPMKDEYAIRHFSLYDIRKYIQSHTVYAEIEASERFRNGKKYSMFRMLISMTRYFVIYYKNGYRNGRGGFMTALSYSFFRFTMFFRLYELENDLTLDKIESLYAKEKEKLI
jgi:glycosyltransferase involved in cell wall biosynthesis